MLELNSTANLPYLTTKIQFIDIIFPEAVSIQPKIVEKAYFLSLELDYFSRMTS